MNVAMYMHTHTHTPTLICPIVCRFDCSCTRSFVTQRGLSLHLSHYPDHKQAKKDTPKKQSEDPPPIKTNDARSPSPSPLDPSSPYNFSGFKTSARNPQYYSIIRTRSSSGAEGETGVKRTRGVSAGAPPAKTMMLNTGEKVATDQEEDEKDTKRTPKDTAESKKGKKSVRDRSTNSETSPEHDRDGTSTTSSGGLKNSPVTRSNSAVMKATEFISLPPTRRRGGRRSGRGRGRGYDDVDLDDECGEGFPPSPSQVSVLPVGLFILP